MCSTRGGRSWLLRPPWIIRQRPRQQLAPSIRLLPPSRRGPTPSRTEPLPRPGWREFLATDLAGNSRKTRAHAFSRDRRHRIDTHPAFLVFDHGPGRQVGRSTESASTLLGRDRGREWHRYDVALIGYVARAKTLATDTFPTPRPADFSILTWRSCRTACRRGWRPCPFESRS